MKYEEMSDYEINKEVSKYWNEISKHWGFEDMEVTFNDENETVYVIAKDGLFDCLPVDHFKPCFQPETAWPIIVDNEINIEFLDGGYVDVSIETDFGTFSPDDIYPKERVFEAAMICFLKMKDAEK